MTVTMQHTVTQSVFDAVADAWAARAADVAAFAATGCPFESWCIWEAIAACGRRGWSATPRATYAAAGVTGSPESANLLVACPTEGLRLIIELGLLHDLSASTWIGKLNDQTRRLDRAFAPDVVGLHVLVPVSPDGPIEVNAGWRHILAIARLGEPDHLRTVALPGAGEMQILAWRRGL